MDAGSLLELCQPLAIRLPHRAAERQVRHSATALHMDESGLAKLFQVVGDSRCGNNLMLLQRAAGQAVSGSDLLQHGEPTRIGDCATDRMELIVSEFVLTTRLAHRVSDAP